MLANNIGDFIKLVLQAYLPSQSGVVATGLYTLSLADVMQQRSCYCLFQGNVDTGSNKPLGDNSDNLGDHNAVFSDVEQHLVLVHQNIALFFCWYHEVVFLPGIMLHIIMLIKDTSNAIQKTASTPLPMDWRTTFRDVLESDATISGRRNS